MRHRRNHHLISCRLRAKLMTLCCPGMPFTYMDTHHPHPRGGAPSPRTIPRKLSCSVGLLASARPAPPSLSHGKFVTITRLSSRHPHITVIITVWVRTDLSSYLKVVEMRTQSLDWKRVNVVIGCDCNYTFPVQRLRVYGDHHICQYEVSS
jgi:hypothetical protein